MGYGPITIPYVRPVATTGSSEYYIHGFDYSFDLNSIFDSQVGTADFKIHQKNDLLFETSTENLYIIQGMKGNKGSSGSVIGTYLGENPFARLFSQGDCYGACGNHNSLFIDPNSAAYNLIMEQGFLASQGITPSQYFEFDDALGYARKITPTELVRVRLDIIDQQARITNAKIQTAAQVEAATTNNAVKIARADKYTKIKGYSPALGAEEGFGTGKI